MPKSHLPAHMDSVRQKLRPKHQLLVLKCYPRLPKNSSADVSPNGSQLSYLLFYATTRSSKLQKVGRFLERKTASDVAHFQSARVTVTLQIITALLDKLAGAESAFEMIAPYVLRILLDLLAHTNDIGLIEASQVTWDAFCRLHASTTLVTNREYRNLFEKVVEVYSNMASKATAKKLGREPVATHDATKLREIGLRALENLVTTSNLAVDTSTRFLEFVIPAVLSNLDSSSSSHLDKLLRRSKQQETQERDRGSTHRQSMNAARTSTAISDVTIEADPRTAEATTQEADALAEEEVSLLALDCLKAIFATENRAQLRGASVVFLDYVGQLDRTMTKDHEATGGLAVSQRWAIRVFELCTSWAPVQDRFVVLVTAVALISRLPLVDRNLPLHLRYIELVDHILRSDLNLIGLSIMDVLLALVQQILQILQLRPSTTAAASALRSEDLQPVASTASDNELSETRLRLLVKTRICIADLATHVYYMDQISDMIAAILLRLKPNSGLSGAASLLNTAVAIQEPREAVKDVAANVANLAPRNVPASAGHGYFSFDLARQIALEAVKDIIAVANSPASIFLGSAAENHTRIPITVWDGTQWLLRDPSFEVRRAYIDALSAWLANETDKTDFRKYEPQRLKKTRSFNTANGLVARRAPSNASRKERKTQTSSFLVLLHLAVFENAMQFAGASEADILLLHALLTSLVEHLGINALHTGFPMVLNLQDQGAKADDAVAQMRIGSLVYGYLLTTVEVLHLQTKPVGKTILDEIDRRKAENWWLTRVNYPPASLDSISSPTKQSRTELPLTSEPRLVPFESRLDLADAIAEAFRSDHVGGAPPTPGSSERANLLEEQISDAKIREPLMASWSVESCLADLSASAPKSQSLSGSRSSPSRFLAPLSRLQQGGLNGNSETNGSNTDTAFFAPSYRQQAFGHLNMNGPDRRASASTNGRESIGSRGSRGTVKVDDLKRILAGNGAVLRPENPSISHEPISDTASSGDSLVEVDESELEGESPVYRTPPQSTAALVSAAPTDGKRDITANGTHLGVDASKPVRTSGLSLAGTKGKNASALLEKIPSGHSEPRAVAMEEPPY